MDMFILFWVLCISDIHPFIEGVFSWCQIFSLSLS
uniref:Uncharacterized protein n=1 Tax=Rhizophora mucronata TaxID=61149 RepID=A0A2P2M9F9_RHIMU